ncbi:hypothetical protein [Nitrospira sp. Nam80]
MKVVREAGTTPWGWLRLQLVAMAILVGGASLLASDGPSPVWAEAPPPASPSDTPVDLAPGGNYASGIRLRIPSQGWSFQVPAQWHATVFEDSELPFLISDEGRSMGMMFPLAHATADEVEHELGQPLALSQGVSFVPTGSLVRTGSRLLRSYVSEATVGRALAVKGPSDQWVIYFLMGPGSESEGYDALLDQLADSTQFGGEGSRSEPREGI